MRKRMLVLGLAVAFLATQLPVAAAQDQTTPGTRTWAAVKAIPPGEKLVLTLKSDQTVEGRLGSVTDDGLTLTRGNNTSHLNREDVRQVYRVMAKSPAKSVLIGAGIGATLGAGGTAAAAASDDREGLSPAAALLPLVGAGIGALVGLAIGGRQKRVLVYESP
jgi:hypothetical protein